MSVEVVQLTISIPDLNYHSCHAKILQKEQIWHLDLTQDFVKSSNTDVLSQPKMSFRKALNPLWGAALYLILTSDLPGGERAKRKSPERSITYYITIT